MTKTSFAKTALLHGLLFLLLYWGLYVTNLILLSNPSSLPSRDFTISGLSDKIVLIGIFYLLAFLSTWFFWCRSASATLEAILSSTFFIWILSSHRNYHIDAPKQVSSLTWKIDFLSRLHLEPQVLIIGLAVIFTLLLILYLVLASNRPLFGQRPKVASFGRPQKVIAVLAPVAVVAALFYYSWALNKKYSEQLTRATEGVGGGGSKEDQSNLGFHSAIGGSKQPAALVRLEGDYSKNPWAPMLYFREGALSKFNGRELVAAGDTYDSDVVRNDPSQPYISLAPDGGTIRQKLVYSVYLLAKHNTPPAIDFPRRIGLIKNPEPNRFELAYQVLSEVPVLKLDDFTEDTINSPEYTGYRKLLGTGFFLHYFPLSLHVGSSKWDKSTLEHYLKAPGSIVSTATVKTVTGEETEPVLDEYGEDLRYRALAQKFAANGQNQLHLASTIIQTLSATSVYTRNPGHQVTGTGDPVAPYLFAKKRRGYCVHFAHAAVYLLRLLGIPARIGTGYLTDLNYAKDGHILLSMGDRHAWPEIYVEGFGWMVMDVNPAEAENEQAPIPDEKLLEELMNKLDPAQELIQPPPDIDEKEATEPTLIERLIAAKIFIPILMFICFSLLALKLWLRFGYQVVREPRQKVKMAYVSFASLMADLGLFRESGETRQEYSNRLKASIGVEAEQITYLNELAVYGQTLDILDIKSISSALKSCSQSYGKTTWRILKQKLAFFSPLSITRLWSW